MASRVLAHIPWRRVCPVCEYRSALQVFFLLLAGSALCLAPTLFLLGYNLSFPVKDVHVQVDVASTWHVGDFEK